MRFCVLYSVGPSGRFLNVCFASRGVSGRCWIPIGLNIGSADNPLVESVENRAVLQLLRTCNCNSSEGKFEGSRGLPAGGLPMFGAVTEREFCLSALRPCL